MSAELGEVELRPEILSRRGEWIAWGSNLLVAGAWLALLLFDKDVPRAVPILAFLLLLAGLSISLGNWMDRQTVMRLNRNGISFRNGLRDVRLGWDAIRQVRVLPSQWGRKVEIIGDQAHFQFRTLGEVKIQGEVKGRMGFADGEQILRRIVTSANLKKIPSSGPSGKRDSYHYTRE